jgi:hypothetical protein
VTHSLTNEQIQSARRSERSDIKSLQAIASAEHQATATQIFERLEANISVLYVMCNDIDGNVIYMPVNLKTEEWYQSIKAEFVKENGK